MDTPLIPEIPASPTTEDLFSDSEEESSIQCGQRTPPEKDDRILLKEETYKKVRQHTEALRKIQATLICLTEEIKSLDQQLGKKAVPKFLRVQRSLPRLPGSLNHSELLLESWDSALLRAGRGLCKVWRSELSSQAKRQRDRFQEKEERAKADLESTEDSVEAKRLLEKLLRSSAKKEEDRNRQQKARRHHPYRR